MRDKNQRQELSGGGGGTTPVFTRLVQKLESTSEKKKNCKTPQPRSALTLSSAVNGVRIDYAIKNSYGLVGDTFRGSCMFLSSL